MKKLMRAMLIVSVMACAAVTGGALLPGETAAVEDEVTMLRVGVFDSRAVAFAYARSKPFRERIASMKAEYREAKAAGDEALAQEMEERGESLQHLLHKQGFSTWPVDDILAVIQDEIPDLARTAGVDLIVSRWDVVYLKSGVELINVTEHMVRPFDPDAETLAGVVELQTHDPVPLEELERHQH